MNQCPVTNSGNAYTFDVKGVPPTARFTELDDLQKDLRPAFWNPEADGYWVVTDYDATKDILQSADVWSSSVIVPTEQNPSYQWIPLMLGGKLHNEWRRLLGAYFFPARVRRMRNGQADLAREMIAKIRGSGTCDFMEDVAYKFPSTVFLQIMGMPLADLDQFMEWEHGMLHQSPETDPDGTKRASSMAAVRGYFGELIKERRARPDTAAEDIVSAAISWTIQGEPTRDADLINCMLLLFIAGLDTVAGQSSYMLYHLATHPEHRQLVLDRPDLIPKVVEELLRLYPTVSTGRVATRDTELRGCPIKAGEVAALPLGAAGRDPRKYPDARRFDVNRPDTHHLSFGAGAHMCLGAHLARQELAVLVEEWHRQIPEYEVSHEPTAHAGGVWALETLPLRWDR